MSVFLPFVTPDPSENAQLIAAFEPALRALLPAPGEPVHAETLLALCLAEGLLEVLQWAQEGTGADPAASMWLAALRWHRVVTGSFPAGAPEPPPRPTDHACQLILDSGSLQLLPHSAESSLTGLRTALSRPTPIGSPAQPAQPDIQYDDALQRVIPISLVPYVAAPMKQDWAAQALCLTHGHPELVAEARRGALRTPEIRDPGPRQELLSVVVEDLAHRWREATKPASR